MGVYGDVIGGRLIDNQYKNLLHRIMGSGREVTPIQGEKSRMIVGHQMRFRIKDGFPVITERDISKFFHGALGEHIGFLNGARTLDELESYGCPRFFWKRWVTKEKCAKFGLEEGDLGPGSYGAAWTAFPTAGGKPFNQVENLIRQIKETPHMRTNLITSWIPQYAVNGNEEFPRQVVVAPCHGNVHVFAYPDTGEIDIHHFFQRSGDCPVGLAFNLIQYMAFGLMVAQVTGYTMRELVYYISDAHIYESQYPFVEELLKRKSRSFPTVTLDPSITNIFDFRPEHFMLNDYDPHPAMKIPTPV